MTVQTDSEYHDSQATRRDLCAPNERQGLSHRPLPDLTQPVEQDLALRLLVVLQEGHDIQTARLLAAIHNELYDRWTAPAGTPNAKAICPAHGERPVSETGDGPAGPWVMLDCGYGGPA